MEITIPVHHGDEIQCILDAVCEADPSAKPEPVDIPAVRGDRLCAGYDENEGGVVVWGDATREELLGIMPEFALEKYFECVVDTMIDNTKVAQRVVKAYCRALSAIESAAYQWGAYLYGGPMPRGCLETARGGLYAAVLEVLEAAVESTLATRDKRPAVIYDDLWRVL